MPNMRDRVRVTTATTGTGTITPGAAAANHRTFAAAYATAKAVPYYIEDGTADFETGYGTYDPGTNTLTRTLVSASSNSGAKLNLSGSAIVGVGYIAGENVADWPALQVSRTDQNPGFQSISTAFTTIALSNAPVVDSHSGWNTSTYQYTVPQAGLYDCLLKLRYGDTPQTSKNYGTGIDTSNVDNAGFTWSLTTVGRQGHINRRVLYLNAGDLLRAYTYFDSSTAQGIIAAELSVFRVR